MFDKWLVFLIDDVSPFTGSIFVAGLYIDVHSSHFGEILTKTRVR